MLEFFLVPDDRSPVVTMRLSITLPENNRFLGWLCNYVLGKLLHPVLDHCYGNVKFCYDFSCASGRIVMVIVIKLTLFKLFI